MKGFRSQELRAENLFPFEDTDAIKRFAPGIWRKITDQRRNSEGLATEAQRRRGRKRSEYEPQQVAEFRLFCFRPLHLCASVPISPMNLFRLLNPDSTVSRYILSSFETLA